MEWLQSLIATSSSIYYKSIFLYYLTFIATVFIDIVIIILCIKLIIWLLFGRLIKSHRDKKKQAIDSKKGKSF